MLPFTTEVFLRNLAQYNAAIWPAQVVAYALGLLAVLLVLRPRRGGDRAVALVLAAFWLWIGVVYHAMFFATINFAAPAFGLLFAIQGLLFAWAGLRGRLSFRFVPDVYGWVGLAFVAFALAVYPLIGWAVGHGWPSAPMFGVAPCPTTIFTLGLLLLAEPRAPLRLAIVPLLWSAIGGSAAWLLAMTEDLSLVLSGVLGLALLVAKSLGPARRTGV